MARRGEGIYLRGKTWRLDFQHERKRYYCKLGKDISRENASKLAALKRAEILKRRAVEDIKALPIIEGSIRIPYREFVGFGVYVYLDKHSRPLYVGRSTDLTHRAFDKKHPPGAFDECLDIVLHRCPDQDAAALLEGNLISILRPKYNSMIPRVT